MPQLRKININVPVRGQAYEYIQVLNGEIRKLADSYVSISESSPHRPHVTIYMGYLLESVQLDALSTAVRQIAANRNSFTAEILRPYIKESRGGFYVFLDVEPLAPIYELKRVMKGAVGDMMAPLDWDVVGSEPHITAGYLYKESREVEGLLETFSSKKTLAIDALSVSDAGDHGVCLNAINIYAFRA